MITQPTIVMNEKAHAEQALTTASSLLERLNYFVKNGGPDKHEYEELTRIWYKLPYPTNKMLEEHQQIFDDLIIEQTVQGFAFRKPHGYAGDFEIIDMIYSQRVSEHEHCKKWDLYFHDQAAPRAVRNRKKYFLSLVSQQIERRNSPVKILNVASGPCRDVLELLESVPKGSVEIECVEMDPKAIKYAKHLLQQHGRHVVFHEKNIFRFDTEDKFDLVWSAGLFDYFEDRFFVKLLRKLARWVAVNGELVVGNFSDNNPSRSYMEKVGQWYLHHRSIDQLHSLATEAGFEPARVRVCHEELGINLFLHIQR